MADNYKTMIPLDSLNRGPGRWQRVYECEVCHGVLFGEGIERERDIGSADSDAAARLSCRLCDESAPLPERYRMALTTVQSACGDVGETPVDCADYGFPSFEKFYSSGVHHALSSVSFRTGGGPLVEAYPHEIIFSLAENWSQLFDSILNGQIEPLNPRRLAQEVVDRVRHDLKLKYESKEA